MLATEVIARKRDGQELSSVEIQWMVSGMLDGSVHDYQMSAWAMAVLCRGMTETETATLTRCMLESGSSLKRKSNRPRVDKHSTGGLGDKVSLILAPLLACFDVDVPMLSGRGLGITGGTLDKLESFPGYRCDLTEKEIETQLEDIGCVITGTTPDIAPADKQLYALRDVTGTVPSPPLITSSILSKKLAESLDALVLDVKFGSGGFMKTLPKARELAELMISTARELGLGASVVLSDMNQPLGRMVGNACEVNECWDILQDVGPQDLRELTLKLCGELLVAVERFPSLGDAIAEMKKCLADGRAARRYQQMIESQSGVFAEQLPVAKPYIVAHSAAPGWIANIDGEKLGQAVIQMGGGRTEKGQQLNHSVGLEMLVEVGDAVDSDAPLVNLFCDDASQLEALKQQIRSAITISEEQVEPLRLIVK